MNEKLRYLFLLSVIYCSTGFTTLSSTEEAFIDRLHFAFNHHLEAWPGNTIFQTPTFIHFNNHHAYALQFTPIQSLWVPYKNFTPPIYFLEKDIYHLDGISLSYGDIIDNQKSYIYSFIEQREIDRNLFVALHERFHAFQTEQAYFLDFFTKMISTYKECG